jgi:arsenite methyltransferase
MKTDPQWFQELFAAPVPEENGVATLGGRDCRRLRGILRFDGDLTPDQRQTQKIFDFLWSSNDRFQDEAAQKALREFYIENYGDVPNAAWWSDFKQPPLIIDAGCGIGLSALNLFGDHLKNARYLGVDMTTAVENAQRRFAERDLSAAFIQCDLRRLPLPEKCADIIYSQGVLHHTDNTRESLLAVNRHLKPGGRILFYVYRKKGPIREFTDDYLRELIQPMSTEEAWNKMMSLTRLGKALGELNVEIDVPEHVELFDIPAGKINIQRLFYWHIFKAFYRPEMTLDEMNHINVDWYAPKNAFRHTEEEVRGWLEEADLEPEAVNVRLAGIGVVARKRG